MENKKYLLKKTYLVEETDFEFRTGNWIEECEYYEIEATSYEDALWWARRIVRKFRRGPGKDLRYELYEMPEPVYQKSISCRKLERECYADGYNPPVFAYDYREF